MEGERGWAGSRERGLGGVRKQVESGLVVEEVERAWWSDE